MPELHDLAPGTIAELRKRDSQEHAFTARVVQVLEPGHHWVEIEKIVWEDGPPRERISSHEYEVVDVLKEGETA